MSKSSMHVSAGNVKAMPCATPYVIPVLLGLVLCGGLVMLAVRKLRRLDEQG